jgi:SulP family sulfate permease
MEIVPGATPAEPTWAGRLRADFRREHLGVGLLAGLIIGILQTAQAASFATLIFSGPLAEDLPRGIGLALFSATVGLIVTALLSSLPVVIGGAQNVPAAILGVTAAALVAGITSQEARVTTVLAAIVLSTLTAGLFLLGLGLFKLAGLVRFLPYPVVGGFLAGTGWLMLTGAIGSMAGMPLQLDTLPALLEPEVLVRWLPGLLLGILILLLSTRFRHYLLLPGIIVAIVAGFYAVALATGTSVAELSANGWLLGPFPEQGIWQPLMPDELASVDWVALRYQVPNLLAAVVMSAIALLLNASALELSLKRDIDMNREMRASGWANLISGLGSGLISYQQLGLTTLNSQFGVSTRWTGLFAAAVTAGTLFLGAGALALLPRLVFGAILVYLGLTFLRQWLILSWAQLPRVDYAIVVLILVVIAFFGFLVGIAVGIVATVIMFVVNYSGVNVVKHALSGTTYRSRVTRPPHQVELLDQAGQLLTILQLQGFLFFGTAHNLLEQARAQLAPTDGQAYRFLLLDFSRVTGIDSTALLSFSKTRQLAQSSHLTILISGMTPVVRQQLEAGDFIDDEVVLPFDTLDQALEWCEDQLLIAQGCQPGDPLPPLRRQLIDLAGDDAAVDVLLRYLERLEVPGGTMVMRRGDPPDALYFIESGQVTAQLVREDGRRVRLETMLGGRVVGELGFYLGRTRTADVVTEAPSVIYRLTTAALRQMEADDPEAASTFHRLIIRLLSERVTHLVGTVDAMQH